MHPDTVTITSISILMCTWEYQNYAKFHGTWPLTYIQTDFTDVNHHQSLSIKKICIKLHHYYIKLHHKCYYIHAPKFQQLPCWKFWAHTRLHTSSCSLVHFYANRNLNIQVFSRDNFFLSFFIRAKIKKERNNFWKLCSCHGRTILHQNDKCHTKHLFLYIYFHKIIFGYYRTLLKLQTPADKLKKLYKYYTRAGLYYFDWKMSVRDTIVLLPSGKMVRAKVFRILKSVKTQNCSFRRGKEFWKW